MSFDTSSSSSTDLGLLGVSVDWLETGLLSEVESNPGLSRGSRIYEIENLRDRNHGVVRRKGADVVCPVDGRPGCSYVHALLYEEDSEDKVGPAQFMLSYTWGYAYGDIVDVLLSYCRMNNLNPKRTYIWICFLCVNQFRVVENQAAGKDVPFDTFRECFQSRVLGTGHILAMMAPWDDPFYLKRVWCIFEFYQAHQHGDQVQITILMPPAEMQSLEQKLIRLETTTSTNDNDDAFKGINSLYQTLAKTKVEQAQASMEEDRVKILELVQENPGFAVLNRRVNDLLREWIHGVLVDQTITKYAQKYNDTYPATTENDLLAYAMVCVRVGEVLRRNNHNLPRTQELFETAVSLLSTCANSTDEVENTPGRAMRIMLGRAHSGLGLVLDNLGCQDDALRELREALAITTENPTHENHSRALALCHANIGSVFYSKGDYDAGLEEYNEALRLYSDANDENTAVFHNGIAELLRAKGQLAKAQFHFQEALKVQLATVGEHHPDTATSYNNIGLCYYAQRNRTTARQKFGQALTIRLAVLGREHLDTAASYLNRGMIHQETRRNDDALTDYREALSIQRAVLGEEEDHLSMATCHNNIGNLLKSQSDLEGALEAHQEALRIRRRLCEGPNHPDIAISYNNIGSVYEAQDDFGSAKQMYRKSMGMLTSSLGENHPSTRTVADNIRRVTSYEEMVAYPYQGLWKETTEDKDQRLLFTFPLHFSIPKVDNIYIKETYSVSFKEDEVIKVTTGGTLLLTLEDDTSLGYSIKDLGCGNHLILRPKPFYKGQLNETSHNGRAYYKYATVVAKDGSVNLIPQLKTRKRLKLLSNNDTNQKQLISDDSSSTDETVLASWTYNAEIKANDVSVTGVGCDIGLLVYLVVLWDRILGERQKAARDAAFKKRLASKK